VAVDYNIPDFRSVPTRPLIKKDLHRRSRPGSANAFPSRLTT